MAGYFVSVEGVEGVGKSTIIQFIQSLFVEFGVDYINTREPGGTPLAEELRQLLLDKRDEMIQQSTELLLMFAARAQNVNHIIIPALSAGKVVLADRFTDATYAYQGAGRGLSQAVIDNLVTLVHPNIEPDLTLLLDAPVEVGRQRIVDKNCELDRIESEQISFFHRVRDGYLKMAKESQRFKIINAQLPLSDVKKQVRLQLQPLLDQWEGGV